MDRMLSRPFSGRAIAEPLVMRNILRSLNSGPQL